MHYCRFCEGMGCYYFNRPKQHWRTCWGCKGHGTVPAPTQPAVIVCKGFNVARKSKEAGKAQAERNEKRRLKNLRKSLQVDTLKE